MSRYIGTVSAATIALFLATGVAVAQEKQLPERQGGGSGAERSGGQGDGARAPARERAPDRGSSGSNAAPERPGAGQGQSSGAEGRAAPQSRRPEKAESPDRGDGATQKRSATERKDAPNRTAGPKSNDNDKRAEPKAKDNQQRTAEPKAKDAGKRAGDDPKGGSSSARVDISPDQRERVRTVFHEQNLRRSTNVNVNIEIGRRLPRTVTLHPLPARIVEIVPRYRSYRYVYVGDLIAIVDPASYEIVYVVDGAGSSGSRVHSASLTLSASEQAMLLDMIDFSQHRADFQFRLALGADVPSRVEIYRFPSNVVDRLPKLDQYRFVVVDRSLLIVDPRDRQIELVVERR